MAPAVRLQRHGPPRRRLRIVTLTGERQRVRHHRPGLSQTRVDTRGTPEDQRACNGDARKFCRKVLADDMAVLHCFQQNRRKLSRACQAVLKKYNQ